MMTLCNFFLLNRGNVFFLKVWGGVGKLEKKWLDLRKQVLASVIQTLYALKAHGLTEVLLSV